MASAHALSSVNSASVSSLTSVKSVASAPAASAAPTSATAPATSAPAANVAQTTSTPQRASTTQVVKSTPTRTASSANNQAASQITSTHSSPSSAETASTSTVSTNGDAASASHSGSHKGVVWGVIAAVLFLVLILAGSFWLLRRRREKFRRLWEAQRMPTANIGKYENEITPEKQLSIEATLAADLARLRSLDLPPTPMNYQNYGRQFPEPTLDFTPKPVSPAEFKIARKPSHRVKNPVLVLPPSSIGDLDLSDSSPTAPAYDAQEYIADFSSKEARTFNPPTITSALPHKY